MLVTLFILAIIGIALIIVGLSGVVGRLLDKGGKNMEGEKNRKKASWKPVIMIAIILVTIAAVTSMYDMVGPAYEFRNEVHGHMENAYYADQPELMKQELELAIDGMHGLDLEKDMYGAFWPWEKTPDRKMDYQYKHLSGILERVDAVIVWRDANYGENATGGTEALGDVYEAKMDNLREFLQEEGWSDWIAQDTFYVNNHLWIYLSWIWYSVLVAIASIYIIYFVINWMIADGIKILDEKTNKWHWKGNHEY